jgi:hypothetical protein
MFDKREKVAVIGAGIFGCTTAIALSYVGYEVVLLERLPNIIMGITRNNTNRVHQGFHYPRDLNTAAVCRDNFKRFINICPEAILNGFPNIYCIAAKDSLTSADEYLRFCDSLDLSYSRIDFSTYATEIRECILGLLCIEAVCDADILRGLITATVRQRDNIRVACNTDIVAIERKSTGYELTTQTKSKLSFDVVINCSYSDINRLTIQLGHKVSEQQFEYTVVPIIDIGLPPQGITIMDGPFMTLLPYGKTGKFTLYHVRHSVIATEISTTVKREWLCPEKSPFASLDKQAFFKQMCTACSTFVPALAEAKLSGFLKGPRMVLANHEKDDARPSILQDYGEGYFTVFSGKIDHSLSIVNSICAALGVSKLQRKLLQHSIISRSIDRSSFFGRIWHLLSGGK